MSKDQPITLSLTDEQASWLLRTIKVRIGQIEWGNRASNEMEHAETLLKKLTKAVDDKHWS
jgi:hypothetical protein